MAGGTSEDTPGGAGASGHPGCCTTVVSRGHPRDSRHPDQALSDDLTF